MKEYEKMHNGLVYDCMDEEIRTEAIRSHKLSDEYNDLKTSEERCNEILKELFVGDDFGSFRVMEKPIFIDLGKEIKIGKNFYSNKYFSFIGGCHVEIGDNVIIGPFCTLATGMHSLIPEERRMKVDESGKLIDFEFGKPIYIGNDVWIASNVTICGGVTIGDGSVIGAGSVVTKDIPKGVLAAGNPCKVIRPITKEDSMYRKKEKNES